MKVGDKIRMALRNFLKIEPAQRQAIRVEEELDFHSTAFLNRLWYRGSASELNQAYRQLDQSTCRFWGSVPTHGLEVRKIHTGIPKLIVNTLTNIVTRDLNDFDFGNAGQEDFWKAVETENRLPDVYANAIQDVLVVGDGAAKISFDPEISEYPIIEWYPGERVEFRRERGRLREIVFIDEYNHKGKRYFLKDIRGYGYVKYELYHDETLVALSEIPETEGLQPVEFEGDFMMAVPFKISDSERWKGRGASIFDGKVDTFDALDEAWSQWVHALRRSRPTTYIPETLIPRNMENGRLMRPNAFDNQFIETGADMSERAQNQIHTEQPDFPADSYNATYITALDMALQGLISPSTLGIDVKKLDNAEAQREKEKATLYTRNNIIQAFSEFLENLVRVVFKSYYTAIKSPMEEISVDVVFGEYANPSFEAVIETLSNPNSPMSIEAKVEELWGDTKDDDWKAEEVRRIKEQSGVVTMEEPVVGVLPEGDEL